MVSSGLLSTCTWVALPVVGAWLWGAILRGITRRSYPQEDVFGGCGSSGPDESVDDENDTYFGQEELMYEDEDLL